MAAQLVDYNFVQIVNSIGKRNISFSARIASIYNTQTTYFNLPDNSPLKVEITNLQNMHN